MLKFNTLCLILQHFSLLEQQKVAQRVSRKDNKRKELGKEKQIKKTCCK